MKDRSNRRSQLCPQETFIISVALRQVSALSSRTEQELTKNFSAIAAVAIRKSRGRCELNTSRRIEIQAEQQFFTSANLTFRPWHSYALRP